MWEGRVFEDLLGDRTMQWATDRSLNIIGEAAGRISRATKDAHPNIDWRRIVRLRNVVVRAYDEVVYARHWRAIQEDPPGLIAELETFGNSLRCGP